MQPLLTARLRLRPYNDQDFAPFHAMTADAETVHAWPAPFTEEKSQNWIRRQIDNYKPLGFGRMVVEERTTGEFVGDCGMMLAEVNGRLENDLGYIFKKEHWGKGYATEAAQAVLNFALKDLKLPRVVANMTNTHTASRRVAEKIGLKFELEFLNKRNRELPTFLYSI